MLSIYKMVPAIILSAILISAGLDVSCKVKGQTKLDFLKLKERVSSLRSDTDTTTRELYEMRNILDKFSQIHSCDQCIMSAKMQHGENKEVEIVPKEYNEADSKMAQILKGFHDEKKHYRENFNSVLGKLQNHETQIDKMEADIETISESQREENGSLLNKIKDLERNIASVSDQSNTQKQVIEQLHAKNKQLEKEVQNLKQLELKENAVTRSNLSSLQESVNKVNQALLISNCDDFWKISVDLKTCFLFVPLLKSWQEASAYCTNIGGKLRGIEFESKYHAVSRFLEAADLKMGDGKYAGFWAGGSDQITEGSWIWETNGNDFSSGIELNRFLWFFGRSSMITNWYPGKPSGSSQDCLVVMINDETFRWDDYQCYEEKTFVCEKAIN